MNIELPGQMSSSEDSSKQEILDAAYGLYIEYGLRRTTMEDVAKRVGIGRATLYRRFSDKEQLFHAVIMRDVQTSLTNIQAAILRQPTFLDGLMESFVVAVSSLHNNPLLTRLLTTEPDIVLPFLSTDFDNVITYARAFIAPQIKKGQKAGHINPNLSGDTVAEMMIRLVHSLMLARRGVINPSDENNIRAFAAQYLKPILSI